MYNETITRNSKENGWFFNKKYINTHTHLNINYCPFCGEQLNEDFSLGYKNIKTDIIKRIEKVIK